MPGHSKFFRSRYKHQEISNRCFTYRLEQLPKYGLDPTIRWRWAVSELGFFFNRNDVARSIWLRPELQQCFTKDEQKNCSKQLKDMLRGYQGHVHHTDVFANDNGYMFVGNTIDLPDLCFICGLRDHEKEYALADFPMPELNHRNWNRSVLIRRALAQELVTGRFYQQVRAQAVLFDGGASATSSSQEVGVKGQALPEDNAKALRKVRKRKPVCLNPQDLSALAAAALGLTSSND